MTFEIGRVLSTCFAIMKQRIGHLIALWAIFFAVSMVFSTVGAVIMGASMMGAGAMASGGLDDPLALGGAGILAFISLFVFYILYIALAFAQQASMTAMASPLDKPDIGDAIITGFKAGLTYSILLVLIGFAMIIAVLGGTLLTVAAAALGEVATILLLIVLTPLGIYLFCRFAVLMPVVAVERVFNPFKAINRAWSVTRGHVIGIFLVTLISMAGGLVMLLLPFLLLFGAGIDLSMSAGSGDFSGAAAGLILLAVLLLIPLYLVWQIFAIALNASLHAAISDDHVEKMSEVFQ